MELCLALLSALCAGFVMNLTPCVLPVLMLKLQAFSGSKRVPYIAGVMVSFMVLATGSVFLGTGLSLLGFGHYRMTLSVVCFLFGLSLFHVWEIPSFGVSGNLGPFAMGCLTVALGSSCAVPFLAPAMAYTASCSTIETYLIFAALGGGFCSPFVLPLSGVMRFFRHYLSLVEKVCGAALVATGVWFASTLPNYILGPAMCITGALLLLLIGITKMTQISTRNFRLAVICGSSWVLLCGSYWLYVSTPTALVELFDIPALDEPQVTFVTADWCMNCKPMKALMQDERIVRRVSDLGLEYTVLDYTDRPPQVTEFLTASYSRDVPVLRIVRVDGTVTVLSGLWTMSAVLEALE